jgi:macrolide-specific efflux system membrane fusion protein
MKKKLPIFLIVILLVSTGAFFWSRQKGHRRRGDMTTERVEAKLGSIEDSVEATGEVLPLNRVAINAPVAGRINQLLVAEGDYVKAGQILAWMSSTDRAAILDAARAQGPAAYKKWDDAYKPTPIIAPLNGTIILLNVVVGQTVDTTVAVYAMSDKLIVKADVDETDVGRIRLGMPAVVTLDSYPDTPIDGTVFQILYEGVNTSNVITYGVKIDPKHVPPFFRSQMTANIRLITKKKENVVLLPEAAITPTSTGERQVMVPGPKGKPVPQTVQVGLENGEQAEIVSGVQDGDTVLVIRNRYTPQQATATSPLVMGGTANRGGGGGGGGRAAH